MASNTGSGVRVSQVTPNEMLKQLPPEDYGLIVRVIAALLTRAQTEDKQALEAQVRAESQRTMPRPDQLCECGHERQEHGGVGCGATLSGLTPGGSCRWPVTCKCRSFRATLAAESPRTLELGREKVRELEQLTRAAGEGWLKDPNTPFKQRMKDYYLELSREIKAQGDIQDRAEGFCPNCEHELMECRCSPRGL